MQSIERPLKSLFDGGAKTWEPNSNGWRSNRNLNPMEEVMTINNSSEAAKAVVRRNTEEVQWRELRCVRRTLRR